LTKEVGKSSPCQQDTTDTNTIIEGVTLVRVEVAGLARDLLGKSWYVRVGTDGDQIFGLSQQGPDYNGYLSALHTGIIKALPDLDDTEESGVVDLDVDDPVTQGTTPGRVRLWVDGVDDPKDILGHVHTPVQEDDPNQYIQIRMD